MKKNTGVQCLDPIEECPFDGNPVSYISWDGADLSGGYGFFFCGLCHSLFDDEGVRVTGLIPGGVPAFFQRRSILEIFVAAVSSQAEKLLPARLEFVTWVKV